MTQREKLRQSIHRILLEEWDPIGIGDNPLCDDEYDGYISGILRLLQTGRDATKLEQHLRQLERDAMGFAEVDQQDAIERRRGVAQSLLRVASKRSADEEGTV